MTGLVPGTVAPANPTPSGGVFPGQFAWSRFQKGEGELFGAQEYSQMPDSTMKTFAAGVGPQMQQAQFLQQLSQQDTAAQNAANQNNAAAKNANVQGLQGLAGIAGAL